MSVVPPVAFLSTYPVRGTTADICRCCSHAEISIHVPRAGYDWSKRGPARRWSGFLSTYPVRGTTRAPRHVCYFSRYFYPRTPCGVRQHGADYKLRVYLISIHVPRAGYDQSGPDWVQVPNVFLSTYPVRGTTRCPRIPPPAARHFYPRTPCGVRQLQDGGIHMTDIFLSTYPVRGTTSNIDSSCKSLLYFYPRTPCGVRLLPPHIIAELKKISIHVPRAGYDPDSVRRYERGEAFLSTYPVRGTTGAGVVPRSDCGISIHVPRAGYDARGRPHIWRLSTFLSTYPVRGTTARGAVYNPTTVFLSTYPVRGTTTVCASWWRWIKHFYPRTPCGVRPLGAVTLGNNVVISIHVPRAGYDLAMRLPSVTFAPYFYPRTPCGVRRFLSGSVTVPLKFLSTYPVRGTTKRNDAL